MNHKKFVKLADTAKKIANNNDLEWSTKYELIFSDEILNKIFTTGIDFEWLDPDTTYEEGVTAFVDAVSKKADELRELEGSQEFNLETLLRENENAPVHFGNRWMCWKWHAWLVWTFDLDARYVELYRGDEFDTAFSVFGRKGEG